MICIPFVGSGCKTTRKVIEVSICVWLSFISSLGSGCCKMVYKMTKVSIFNWSSPSQSLENGCKTAWRMMKVANWNWFWTIFILFEPRRWLRSCMKQNYRSIDSDLVFIHFEPREWPQNAIRHNETLDDYMIFIHFEPRGWLLNGKN